MSNVAGSGVVTIAAIPAYNEAASIAAVVVSSRQYVSEVIVIDDGSTDETAQIAEEAGATVITHEQNLGKAAAIMTAFSAATERDADALVLLDGDSQHNPDDIPTLLAPILEGTTDLVVGSRFLSIRNPTPFYRTIGQRVLNVATRYGSRLPCSDSQSGFRALSRRAFTSMTLCERFLHGLAAESEMQFEAAERGLGLREVPIYVRYDTRARRSPIKHGFGVLYRVLVIAFERRRLEWLRDSAWSLQEHDDAPSEVPLRRAP